MASDTVPQHRNLITTLHLVQLPGLSLSFCNHFVKQDLGVYNFATSFT